MDKQETRAAIRDIMQGIPPEDLAERSRRVAGRLAETAAWKKAKTIFCFLSMPRELPTGPIIEIARRQGKRLAGPRIEDGDIVFVEMPVRTGALPRDRWGIPVPDPLWPRLDIAAAGTVLVVNPGLAFDRDGNRVGRGKGYYDRFLARARQETGSIAAIGVCLSEQVLPAVPHEDHDQPLDGLVTEAETLLMGHRRS